MGLRRESKQPNRESPLTDPLTIAGLTALGTLLATEATRFLWSRWSIRSSPGVLALQARVPTAAHGMAVDESADAGRSAASEMAPETAVEQPVPAASQDLAPDPSPARRLRATIYINAPEQVREFLEHMTAEGYARPPQPRDPRQGTYSHEIWWSEYLNWAATRSIAPLAADTFKANIKKHPRIRAARGERLKDRHGRVVLTPGGSPVRPTTYTLFEIAPVEAVTTDPVTGRRKTILVQPHEVQGVKRKKVA